MKSIFDLFGGSYFYSKGNTGSVPGFLKPG